MAAPMLQARNETRETALAVQLSVADGLVAKFRGLIGRPSLDTGAGLWFPDSNGIHMMFMRFPIDAVFLGKPEAGTARRVVKGQARVQSASGPHILPHTSLTRGTAGPRRDRDNSNRIR